MAWGKKDNFSSEQKLDTIIGKDTRFQGTLETGGGARIDGRYKGALMANGDVIIGESAMIEADVTGRNILIAGEVRGHVYASGKMELTNTGKLYGDLQASKMFVEEGAVFLGECKTIADNVDKNEVKDPIPETTES